MNPAMNPVMGRLLRCRGLFCLCLLAIFFVSLPEASLHAAEAKAEGDLPFRRLFVPADTPESWPVGSERFLPIPGKDFLQLVEQKKAKTSGERQRPLHISKAVYRAKLLPGNVLSGTAEWTIELPGENPRLLPLAPSNFAIQSATWRRDPKLKASVGLWEGSEEGPTENLKLAVLVEQSGVLVMRWQLAARSSDAAVAVFDLLKPTVIPQTLELDLPANHTATLSRSKLLRNETAPLGAPSEESRWVFQLAPRQKHRLRIHRQALIETAKTLPLVSQTTSYQLDPSGLKVLTQLRLDARESETAELTTALPAGLRVVQVDIDQQPVEWRVVDSTDFDASDNTGSHAGVATLLIPRPESRQPQLVEIRCLAKSLTETRWELPKLQFDEVAWTEGTTSLLVSPELELRSLLPRQATLQHIVGVSNVAREGEVFRLQEWSQEAAVEIEVGRPQPRLTAQTLTTIELGRDVAPAKIAMDFSNSGGDVYQFHAAVAEGWTIDSVVATPQSTLNEWHLDPAGKSATLAVQLNQPISPQQPLRLDIEAHQTTGEPVLPATVGQLKILHSEGTETSDEWLLLRTRKPEPLARADLLDRARFSRDALPAELRSSTPEDFVGTLLKITQLDEDEVLKFRLQPAEYEADLRIEVDAFPDSLRQRYQIDCHVRSGAVTEIIVEMDAPLPETIAWTLHQPQGDGPSDRPGESTTIERLNTADQLGTTTKYAIRFPVAIADDFRLQASYSQAAQPIERCNLLRLLHRSEDESLGWKGHVLLRGSLLGLQVLDQGWTPTVAFSDPLPKNAASENAAPENRGVRLPLLGTYRISPEELRRSRVSAGLRMQRQETAAPAPSLIAWLAEYHTLQAADGASLHTAHFFLENFGADEATIVLPAKAKLQEAWLDDQQLDLKQLATDDNTFQFRLGREQQWPYLALKYSIQAASLERSASLKPAVPECSFAVNQGQWTLWAPEQYEIDATLQNYSSQSVHWWKRLFGPLTRSRGETVFNPLSSASWKQLGSVLLEEQPTQVVPALLPKVFPAVLPKVAGLLEMDFVSLGDHSPWLRAAPVKNPQWNSPLAATFAKRGRRARTVEFIEDLPTLTVRRAYVQRALWYALLLLTVVLGVWQLAHYPNATILAAAVAGAACLVVPAQWLTLPQAVFLGLIAAAIVRAAMKSSQFWDARASALPKATQAATLTVLAWASVASVQAQAPNMAPNVAENVTPNMTEKPQGLPKVLVPIDSEGSPQGEDVYLSESTLKKLKHSPRKTGPDGAKLVLLAASYSGSLANKTDPWTLRWKVESFVPGARLFLPLRRDEATWNASLHRLDGVPVKIEWQADGHGCWATLPERGVHWLQLVAQPRRATADQSTTLRLHVPPLPGATLDLVLSPHVDDLQVAGGVRTSTPNPLKPWRGLLGAKEILEIRWTSEVSNGKTASWERIEQSAWLHVEPATTRLEVQLTVTGYQAHSQLLELDISPQLQLKPLSENSPIAQVMTPSLAHPTRLQLKLRTDLPADFVIPLHFELQRAASVGRLFFPKMRLRENPPAKNLFAVSVSAGLSYDEQGSNSLRSIEPAEFSSSWNAPAKAPLYAYSLGPQDPEWSLRVWPDPQSLTAQQSLRVHCLPNALRVDFEAVINELSGSWLMHRVEVPKSLQIDTITVHETPRTAVEATPIPVRWSRISATEAVVFLGQPLRDSHVLRLQGHLGPTKENEIALPQVRLLSSKHGEIRMELFRTEEVQVSWTIPRSAPLEIPEQRTASNSENILVGHFSWRPSQVGELSKIRLKKNKQQFEAVSVTTVHRDAAGWMARMNSQLSIQQGVVSRLSLTVPNSFRKPFHLLPAQIGVVDEVLETSEGKEIVLLLTQPAAAGEQVELQLSGRLSLPADGRLVIPSLAWNGAAQQERYVLLPKSDEQQPLQWQTTGLQRQPLPPQLSSLASSDETAHSFRIEQNPFAAKERTNRGTLSNAMVRYAHVSGVLDAGGGFLATAELVLQPGRATSCAIRLPLESQLRQLTAGNRPVRRELLADGSWKLPLGPPFMPQRIVVNYRTQLGPLGKRLRLAPPEILIGDQVLPAPQTWWRIRTTQGLQLSAPKVGRFSDPSEFIKTSYEHPRFLLQDSLSRALDLPRQEGQAWAKTWQAVLQQAERAWQAEILREEILRENETGNFSEQEDLPLASTTNFTETFAAAFATEETPLAERFRPPSYPPLLPFDGMRGFEAENSNLRKEHLLVSDSQGQLELAVSQGVSQNPWQWLAALALVAGALTLVLRLKRNPRWHYDLCYWPHSLALVGGIVWWLLLKPSAVGLLVIALALISLTLKRWRFFRRSRPKKSNTQLAVPTS